MTTLKPPKPTHQYQYSYRSLYLSAIGWIQLIAYWSYYVQFPGLLSSSGIEPVHRVFSRAAPSLHQAWIQSGQKIDEDSLCELLALSGMILAALIASGWCQHAVLFAANVAIYGLLVRTGGTFYSFQWDTLLLETTTVTCLTFAPWWRFRPDDNDQSPVVAIPLRFLLFKLMFMSGIVKLQAHCPTWEHLTALEYHFATQCLPGPLAWHAHQLHPFLLRLGVAITLWIELPATVLLVLPLKSVRRVGALLQLSLQVLIILTGNYNFFNLLTMALCIPVWEQQQQRQQQNDNHNNAAGANKKQKTTTILRVLAEQLFCWTFLIGTFFSMFRIDHVGPDQNLNIVLLQDSMWIQPQVFLPWVPCGTLVLIAVTTLVTTTIPRPSKIFHGLVCFLVVGIVALPIFHQIPLDDNQTLRPGPWFRTYIQPYWLVHGYGLFRRMTGVGTVPGGATGWAGVPPSAVARPEIILEGLFAVDNDEEEEEWHELDMFRWKPGAVNAMPRQMAPHQPRLDWQMWFAALGNINHNPWLVHLIHKLLEGCEPVMDLVGAASPSMKQLQKIRGKLYHYDFTRLNTTWSRTIPGVEILPSNDSSLVPSKVWSRKLVHEYLPPVGTKELKEFLRSHGYKRYCVDPKERCVRHPVNPWCPIATSIRQCRIYLLIPFSLVLLVLSRLWRRQRLVPRQDSPVTHKQKRGDRLEEKKNQ